MRETLKHLCHLQFYEISLNISILNIMKTSEMLTLSYKKVHIKFHKDFLRTLTTPNFKIHL